jgi:hypothetical protein
MDSGIQEKIVDLSGFHLFFQQEETIFSSKNRSKNRSKSRSPSQNSRQTFLLSKGRIAQSFLS